MPSKFRKRVAVLPEGPCSSGVCSLLNRVHTDKPGRNAHFAPPPELHRHQSSCMGGFRGFRMERRKLSRIQGILLTLMEGDGNNASGNDPCGRGKEPWYSCITGTVSDTFIIDPDEKLGELYSKTMAYLKG
jgi:hypothetical protein